MVNLLVRTKDGGVPVRVMRRSHGGDIPIELGIRSTTVVSEPGTDPVQGFLDRRPFYISHRLGGHDFPEHTIAGMEASIRAGYKAFEFSTYRTSDGVYIGSHDWTTERTAGVRHEIWNTSWETIQTLSQPGGPFIRLEDMVQRLPDDAVVFLDHKATSAKGTPNSSEMESETALFDLLEKLFPDPTKRVVWKVFAEASSAARAKARGYKVNCMLYPSTAVDADFSRWDVLGMEYSAQQEVWDQLKATGKPVLAHIIYNQSQAQTALSRGADGLMVSVPTSVYP